MRKMRTYSRTVKGMDEMKDFKTCQRCGSEHIIKAGKTNSKKKGLWFQKYHCRNCNLKFNGVQKRMNEPMPFQYKSKPIPQIDWKSYTKAQNQEKLMLMHLTKEITDLIEIKTSKRVGRNHFNLKDIIFCLTLKTYGKLSSRRLHSDLEIARQERFIEKVPHFTTLMNYMDDERLTPLFKKLIELSALPLKQVETKFAIDSSGFSTNEFGRWLDDRMKKNKMYRKWVKAHIMTGVQSNIITSVEVTSGNSGDSLQFIPLVNKTSINFSVKEVSGDKAYSSKANLEAVDDLGGTAFIPFRSNVLKKKKGISVWNNLYWYFKNRPQEWHEHYHLRSNSESCFAMIKSKFGKNLFTKNYAANKNELLLKILCHNFCVLIQEFYEHQLETNFSTESPKITLPLN